MKREVHSISPSSCLTDILQNPISCNIHHQDQLLETSKGIAVGDHVRLAWVHEYVHQEGSSFPERPMTKLEKLTADQAQTLMA